MALLIPLAVAGSIAAGGAIAGVTWKIVAEYRKDKQTEEALAHQLRVNEELSEALTQAGEKARLLGDPATYRQEAKTLHEKYVSLLPQMDFIHMVPREYRRKRNVMLIGKVSSGKSALINKLFGTDEPVGVGHTTEVIVPVDVGSDTIIWDSPGSDQDFQMYHPDAMNLIHSVQLVVIVYSDSLSTIANIVRVVYAIKDPSQVQCVRTQCDVFSNSDHRLHRGLKAEMDRDEQDLQKIVPQARPILRTATLGADSFDNEALKRFVCQPLLILPGTTYRWDPSIPHPTSIPMTPEAGPEAGGQLHVQLREFISPFIQNGGMYSAGMRSRAPVRGFSVERIDIAAPLEEGLDRFEGKKSLITKLRAPDRPLKELMTALEATPADPEKFLILEEMKRHFVGRTRKGKPNVMYVFHGTKVEDLKSLLEVGFLKLTREDQGYFGHGCYTTTSIEYAARYACGDLSSGPRPPHPETGCWPVIMFAALVGVAYPVTRGKDYANPAALQSKSKFFGKPLFNGTVDTHIVPVNQRHEFQACPVQEAEYLEIVSEDPSQLIPLAVLWVKRVECSTNRFIA